jgi:hypothetical protein
VNFLSSKTAPPEPDSLLAGRLNFSINNRLHHDHTLQRRVPEVGATNFLQRLPRTV